MPDYRGTEECGQSQPFNFLWMFGLFRRHSEPEASKFEGKWFGGNDPEDRDQVLLDAYARRAEEYAEVENQLGYKRDNVSQMKYRVLSSEMKSPQYKEGPAFSDFRVGSYVYGYNKRAQIHHRYEQWAHCVGQLGEDHPTCNKAAWYYGTSVSPPLAATYEEWNELGHWDGVRKWGSKPRRSFLPRYQPVKNNIPGAYEYFRSSDYLERYAPDGQGELLWPATLTE